MKRILLLSLLMLIFTSISAQLPLNWYLDVVTPGDVSLEPNTSQFTDGSKSCQLNLLLPNVPYLISDDFPVTPGTSYTFAIDVLQNDPRGYLKIYADFRSSTGSSIWGEDPVVVTNNPNWQTITWTGVVPANAAVGYVLIKFYHTAAFVNYAMALVDHCRFIVDGVNLVVNGSFEQWGGVNVVRAYTSGPDRISVVFDGPAPDNPALFQLSGTANITFTTATVDGQTPNLLHLTNPSQPLTGDLVIDQLTYTVTGTSVPLYAGILPIASLNTVNPGGTVANNIPITLKGIVFACNAKHSTWFHDASGSYNGVMIFSYDLASTLNLGDEVLITGKRNVYFNNTEVGDAVLLSRISTGNELFPASVITGAELSIANPADTLPAEKWEGQLVRINAAKVLSYDNEKKVYVCSDDNEQTTFYLGDEANYNFAGMEITPGKTYHITGVVNYKANYYRINPRFQDDLIDVTTVSEITVNPVQIFPNPVHDYLHITGLIHVDLIKVIDLTGKELISQPVDGRDNLLLPVDQLRKGLYLIQCFREGTMVSSNRFAVR